MMKNLFGKNLLHSILHSVLLFLAVGSIYIGAFCLIGAQEAHKKMDSVLVCADGKKECKEEKWDDDSEVNNWEISDKLEKKYPENHQAIAMYTNHVSSQTSLVLFALIGNTVIAFFIFGVIAGIILHYIYKKKYEEETKKAKRKSTKKK